MFVQLCFPVLQTEKNVKVLTVVLKRHMSEEEDADLASSTISSNDTHIFHSDVKRNALFPKTSLITFYSRDSRGRRTSFRREKGRLHSPQGSLVFLVLSDLCLEDRTAAPSRMSL